MSDKGISDIVDILMESDDKYGAYYMLDNEELAGVIINTLRSHGWLHDSDVVEGKHTEKYSGDPAHRLTRKPATVKDLIG